MNIENEIDKILGAYGSYLTNYNDHRGRFDPMDLEEAKARLIVLIDHGGLETSSDTAPVGGNQVDKPNSGANHV